MSANIRFEPVKAGRDLPVNAPSSFIEAVSRAGYDLPCVLSGEAIPLLRGLAAGMPHEKTAIEVLIEAIEQHGDVRVWAEY